MEIGSLSGNRNLLIIIAILAMIGGFVWYWLTQYQPLQAQIVEKEKVVEQKKDEVRKIELTKKLLGEAKEEIARLKADIARLEKFFPENVFIPRVLVLIENLALATHVEIDSIRPSVKTASRASARTSASSRPAAAGKNAPAGAEEEGLVFDQAKEYTTSQVDFRVKGSFQNIYNFMEELATFPKLVIVDQLTLSTNSGAGDDETTEAERASAETGREIEVGGYVELNADLPLTFYIQKKESPAMEF